MTEPKLMLVRIKRIVPMGYREIELLAEVILNGVEPSEVAKLQKGVESQEPQGTSVALPAPAGNAGADGAGTLADGRVPLSEDRAE